jgi:exopolyphosphatase/guanosine-5'-triphosphate,3'-diphosphate pyrophosphatase
MIRLGDGVFKTGKLSPEGMKRTLNAFVKFKRQMRLLRVDRVVAFGTSALRTAKNAKAFVQNIEEKTGIAVRVISGREEALLIAKGIQANIEVPRGTYALVDIGGGSTEISLCSGKRMLSSYSHQLGANRLQQVYFKTIPPVFKRGELHPVLALRQELKNELFGLSQKAAGSSVKTVIGSSGTIRTISKILKKLGHSGQPIFRSDLSGLISEIQSMTREQLRRLPGLEPKRIDLILSGAILLEEIMFSLGADQIYVTDYALRDGILVQELNGV